MHSKYPQSTSKRAKSPITPVMQKLTQTQKLPEYFQSFANKPNTTHITEQSNILNNLEWESLDAETRKKLTPLLQSTVPLRASEAINVPKENPSNRIKELYKNVSQGQLPSSPTKSTELFNVIKSLQTELTDIKKEMNDMNYQLTEKDTEIARITQKNKDESTKLEAKLKEEHSHSLSEKYNKYLKKAEDMLQASNLESKEQSLKEKIKEQEEKMQTLAEQNQSQKDKIKEITLEKETHYKKAVEEQMRASLLEKQLTNLQNKYKTEKIVWESKIATMENDISKIATNHKMQYEIEYSKASEDWQAKYQCLQKEKDKISNEYSLSKTMYEASLKKAEKTIASMQLVLNTKEAAISTLTREKEELSTNNEHMQKELSAKQESPIIAKVMLAKQDEYNDLCYQLEEMVINNEEQCRQLQLLIKSYADLKSYFKQKESELSSESNVKEQLKDAIRQKEQEISRKKNEADTLQSRLGDYEIEIRKLKEQVTQNSKLYYKSMEKEVLMNDKIRELNIKLNKYQ